MGNLKILWNVRILRLQSLASMWSCKNFSLTCIITRKSAKTNGIIDEIFSSVIFTDRYNSVSTSVVENTDRIIPSVKFSGKIFFFGALTVCKTVGVWLFFFISDRISDGMKNYWRSIFRRTDFVGEVIGKNFTDELRALHQRNEYIDKTI
jgi:hypothetical protein